MVGYVTTLLAFVCGKLPAQEANSFCDFWKMTSCNFITFFSYLTWAYLCFLEVSFDAQYIFDEIFLQFKDV